MDKEMKKFNHKNLKIINADCMDIMKQYEDNYFDLAIVDPPYGIGLGGGAETVYKNGKNDKGFTSQKKYKNKKWDDTAPSKEYFNELIRVSKNQIIWGGNYFTDKLPVSRGWIYWDKKITNKNNNCFSDGELAYTSFNKILKKFTYDWIGFGYVNNPDKEKKIHPTQKPVRLYKWLLENYADQDFKILDTHLGSGSSAIAGFYYGCKEFVGIELDEDYYNASIKRIKEQTAQIKLL
jgi:site-specific DNA-methyltransferase (adenine-specific)